MKSYKNWLKYWKNSLIDAERLPLDFNETNSLVLPFSFLHLMGNSIPLASVAAFFSMQEEKWNRENNIKDRLDKGWKSLESFDIYVALFTLTPQKAYLQLIEQTAVRPFWIPAVLSREGVLKAPKDFLPYVQRDFLEPAPDASRFVFSTVELIEKASSLKPDKFLNWEAYLAYVEEFFLTATEMSLENYEEPCYTIKQELTLVARQENMVAAAGIIDLYDNLIGQDELPDLLKRFIGADTLEACGLVDKTQYLDFHSQHVGQMSSLFPLSISQRKSLYHFIASPNGSVFAVNGPPGTGKTTLLQSVVANAFVQAAIEGKDAPIILACSANNQAVTNISESFSKTESNLDVLAGRWLPNFDGYATYLPAANKNVSKSINYIHPNWKGTFDKLEKVEYREEAEAHYIVKANVYFQKSYRSLSRIVNVLRQEILQMASEIAQAGNANSNIKWKDAKGHNGDPLNGKDLGLTFYEQLDTQQRHKAFQLAVHYWEGRWLEAMNERGTKLIRKSELGRKQFWRTRAMLTPCFVSTFYMAPKFFLYYVNTEVSPQNKPIWAKHYLLGFIDLLVVDEAGQAIPEIGVAIFSLAKKAIVVGDVKQIEPLWNIVPTLDAGNLKKFELIDSMNDSLIESFTRKGFLASSGSIMKMAQNACDLVEPGYKQARGMILTEHRRCNDEIIQYCNDLAYSGMLKPMKGKADPRQLFPSLLHLHVEASSNIDGKSRSNLQEATFIVDWLIENKVKIESHYSCEEKSLEIEDLVGIITPFRGQKMVLLHLLKNAGFATGKMKVGTIHALQGAEREIIIFSTVYGFGEVRTMFFDTDKKPNMLNVAVSRAKESFIVVGNKAIFKVGGRSPSGLLAKYIQKSMTESGTI